MNTDAWDYLLYTKFNDTLTYGVLIITTTKSSSWLNSNTSVSILYGIIRPSQNDKNMPRVSGRATVRVVRHLSIIFIPGFSLHGHKGFWTQSSVRSHAQKRKGSSWCFFFCLFVWVWFLFLFLFFLLLLFAFYKPIERTMTVHVGRRTDGLVRKKRPKSHWKADTSTCTLHYLYLWVILDVTEYHIIMTLLWHCANLFHVLPSSVCLNTSCTFQVSSTKLVP